VLWAVAPDGLPLAFPSEDLDLLATLRAETEGAAGPLPAEGSPGRGVSFLGEGGEAEAAVRTPAPADPPRDEDFWRGLADEARSRVRRREEEIVRLEEEVRAATREAARLSLEVAAHGGPLAANAWHPELVAVLKAARERTRSASLQLEESRAALEQARRELETDLPEAARRAGVPPGWLRERRQP